jgi:N-acetylmuramic acid 6-phosphate etherase
MTESVDPQFGDFDRWPIARRLEALVAGNGRAVAAVLAAVPDLERAAVGIAGRLRAGGRLVYAGAGTSGRLALQDAAELPPTFDFERTVVLLAGGSDAGRTAREGAEDDVAAADADVVAAGVGEGDAVVGLAASGRTPYTLASLRRARAAGAFTVGIANNPGSPLLEVGEVGVLLDTGPEVIAGSTRMTAGTAQKIALNALSTAVLVELGGVYRNLMVRMRPTNDKLRMRAIEIVKLATDRSADEAAAGLAAAGWDLRTAIVMLRSGIDADAARRALEARGGHVRAAIEAAGHVSLDAGA